MPDTKKTNSGGIKNITDKLEAGIKDVFESERYKTWLNTMSRFHVYSLNNTILIAMQRPDATLVAGYDAWKKKFKRNVKKNEKGIQILAPTKYKQMVEVDAYDPNTHELLKDAQGEAVKEQKEVTRIGFKVVKVFDISQTEGEPLPSIGVNELTGDIKTYDDLVEVLKRTCPVSIAFEEIRSGSKGYYHQADKNIVIQKDMSQIQTIKTMIHEMAHQRLHDKDENSDQQETKIQKEVEAESIAYVICQYFGIDTSEYSFGYIVGWSQGKEIPELKASMQRIRDTSSSMIEEINVHLGNLKREHETITNPKDSVLDQLHTKLSEVSATINDHVKTSNLEKTLE